MKIINRQQFLAYPENTLYSKYTPCFFEDIKIKGNSIGDIDFYEQDIAGCVSYDDMNEFLDVLEDAEKNGTNIEIDLDIQCRDGLFDEDQLFAIWEKQDIEKLIARLQQCVETS